MAVIWNSEDVKLFDTVSSKFDNAQLWITGMGSFKSTLFTWCATATPTGWLVEIYRWSACRTGQYQGVTHNLLLEIATAARRLL